MSFYKGIFCSAMPTGNCKVVAATTMQEAEIIHVPTHGESIYDIITLYAANLDANGDHIVTIVLPSQMGSEVGVPVTLQQGMGWYPILPAMRIIGRESFQVKVFGDTSSVIGVIALVDRLTSN